MDVPYPVVIGVIAGVLEFVPMIGPLIAAIVAVGIGLTSSLKLALLVGLFLALLRFTQDYVIYPRIIGHGIKMHPIVVILAVFAGAEVGGIIGIFLAIPVVGLIIVGFNHYMAFRGTLSQAVAAAVGPDVPPDISVSPDDAAKNISSSPGEYEKKET
jgi:predicted PurR-regulated permease PerM